MDSAVNGIWTQQSRYQRAICKECKCKIEKGEVIVCISRTVRFSVVSNYHLKCAEPAIMQVSVELGQLMMQLHEVGNKIDELKEWEKNNAEQNK